MDKTKYLLLFENKFQNRQHNSLNQDEYLKKAWIPDLNAESR